MMSDVDTALRALRSLDLTDLSDNCSETAIDLLCVKARDPRGPVAAVCVWPQFVRQAARALAGTPVRVATVVNFPAGGEDVARVCDDVDEAQADGAQAIDLVLPYHAASRGDWATATGMIEAIREHIKERNLLKVILETGELADPTLIDRASRSAISAGADFIKTSTGKTAISATPQAATIMLHAIKGSGRPVGLKPSGGIRTLADARTYLDLADAIMGESWATPQTFRIGASGVYDVLIAIIEGRSGPAAAGVY